MSDVNATWINGIEFNGRAGGTAAVPLGNQQEDFRPMELIALGLAGCTAMDVISILEKKRQNVTNFEVRVYTEQASEHPKVFTKAKIEYLVSGHSVDKDAVLRSIELSATRYCPAQAMLEKIFPIELEYSIFEDQGDGEHKLVVGGTYTPNVQPA